MRRDADQQRIVERLVASVPGEVHRVGAGAGSGKTFTVVELLADLLEQGCAAARLYAITFSRKAADELQTRLAARVGSRARRCNVTTFHGLALREPYVASRSNNDRCMDRDAGQRAADVPSSTFLWRDVVTGYREIPGLPQQKGLDLGEVLEKWRLRVRDYSLEVDIIRADGHEPGSTEARAAAARVEHVLPQFTRAWELFERAKGALGGWDYADALAIHARGLRLGEARPEDGAFVIVDEAQDNSRVQLEIARALSATGVLVLVGDERQCVHRWRGAWPEMFLTADTVLGATSHYLSANYRSRQEVVVLGNAVSKGKAWSLGVPSSPQRPVGARFVRLSGAEPMATAELVAQRIAQELRDPAHVPGDYAVLARTRAALGPIEVQLLRRQIPVVVAGASFFTRAEVQDFLAYVMIARGDVLPAFKRVANKPKRFLGTAYVTSVEHLVEQGMSLPDATQMVATQMGRARNAGSAQEFATLLAELRRLDWPTMLHRVKDVLDPLRAAGAPEGHTRDPDAADASSAYATLLAVALGFAGAKALRDFSRACLSKVGEVHEGEAATGAVTLSTIHRAKGLEWRTVVLDLTEGMLPHRLACGPAEVADEERLLYVAVTRAKEELWTTWSAMRADGGVGGPSRFMALMPPATEPVGEVRDES